MPGFGQKLDAEARALISQRVRESWAEKRRNGTARRKPPPPKPEGLDKVYLATMETFYAWCRKQGRNFRGELIAAMQKRMDQ